MLPPIPVLADYGISAKHGFLPDDLPLARLPDPYYNKWEAVVANLQALILSRRLRGVVDRLPVLSTDGLEHVAEWRRAYCILCFMAHGYVWGGDRPSDRLPPPLAVPLLAVSTRLEVPPVATFAAVCLWNFKPLFVDEGVDRLENLATLNTLTGSLDESWFYLVSVAIEARGGPMIAIMLAAMATVRRGEQQEPDSEADTAATVTACLCAFAERLDDLTGLLQRLHEQCDPTVFYHRIRPFLAGSKNMADAGLPHGLIYDDGTGHETYRQYSGGSNAQSSLIQFFDIVLGIEHRPTGDKGDKNDKAGTLSASEPPPHNFIMEMRQYMPGPHARFLRDVAAVANIRPYVLARPHDRPLAIAYDACLSMLRALRDRHIAIVTRYIVVPSREAMRARSRSRSPETVRRQPAVAQPKPVNLARPTDSKQLKGTGGTALIAFLKQARDETGEPAVEDWARRFLGRQARGPGKNDFFFGKPDESPLTPEVAAAAVTDDEEEIVGGMAGTWTIDDDVGGLCQY
ncbi:indoleamine-dioxygenase subfamily [Grosmannia clavigera kw1407]|uniref:Indoleamine-dioxygenase subfamily n=1 Tax=Grosmannia clavigera (strain kw1407 / UAMH 11150) TaxID=655863 RepID=F0XDK5_GROCL|nr:indoleamine-dioxygenase subfamily [Grosmannia clavigera kw1407]EFX04004.1 indoleamine-dioxygenase subfamily [Grosmannia clavigera kw1407]